MLSQGLDCLAHALAAQDAVALASRVSVGRVARSAISRVGRRNGPLVEHAHSAGVSRGEALGARVCCSPFLRAVEGAGSCVPRRQGMNVADAGHMSSIKLQVEGVRVDVVAPHLAGGGKLEVG